MIGVEAESSSSVVLAAEVWWPSVDCGWGWGWGWATAVAFVFIFAWHYAGRFFFIFLFSRLGGSNANLTIPTANNPQLRLNTRRASGVMYARWIMHFANTLLRVILGEVPPGLDTKNRVDGVETFSTDSLHHSRQSSEEAEKSKKLLRRPSKKVLANGVIFLGGIIYLTRGNPAVGAKVAMAYILTKLSKRGRSSSCQSQQQQ